MSTFRDALRMRKTLLGGWLQIGHPGIAEIFGRAGFDWVCADMEHGDTDGSLPDILRALGRYRSVPLARVEENNTLKIRRALDLGAQGVIVPLVNTREEAEKAVAAAKYPPEGIRGFAFCRANEWGSDFDRSVATANADIAVIVMIESKAAVENIDEILQVKGVDGVFIGPYDMSGSYGVIGQTEHPLIQDACKKVTDACARAGKSAGLHIVLPSKEKIEKAQKDGFTFIALGMDTVFLAEGAQKSIEYFNKEI